MLRLQWYIAHWNARLTLAMLRLQWYIAHWNARLALAMLHLQWYMLPFPYRSPILTCPDWSAGPPGVTLSTRSHAPSPTTVIPAPWKPHCNSAATSTLLLSGSLVAKLSRLGPLWKSKLHAQKGSLETHQSKPQVTKKKTGRAWIDFKWSIASRLLAEIFVTATSIIQTINFWLTCHGAPEKLVECFFPVNEKLIRAALLENDFELEREDHRYP